MYDERRQNFPTQNITISNYKLRKCHFYTNNVNINTLNKYFNNSQLNQLIVLENFILAFYNESS